MLLTVSNLFPRPDQPGRGLFNLQLFDAFAEFVDVRNVCLVPSWRLDRWPRISEWASPTEERCHTSYAPAFHVPVAGRNLSWRFFLRALKRLPIERRSVEAVYNTWLYPDGVAAARFAAEIGSPCWIMVQGSDVFHLANRRRRQTVLNAAEHVTGFLCLGDRLAGKLVDAGVPSDKVSVISNGVDKQKFQPRSQSAARSRLGLPANSPVVIFVGNLVPVKGPDVLIDAWNLLTDRLGERSSPVQPLLAVIGDGPMRESLQATAGRGPQPDSVKFVGRVPHADIPVWMNAADMLCLSSRHEGMPNVVLESMSSGLKIVSTDVGSCEFLLKDYPAGRVVPPENPQQLAAALEESLSLNPDQSAIATAIEQVPSWRGQARLILSLMGLTA